MKNAVKWMAGNHVAANLLMMIFIVGGLIKMFSIKQEVFPEISLDMIQVSVLYPGAGPEEIEEGILLKIEDNLTGVDGIKEIRSVASEGMGTVTAEIIAGQDADLILQNIKSEVDRIITFPQDAEKPIITKLLNRQEVISVVIYGDLSERSLREQAEAVREELLALPQITQVDLGGVRPYEISIEIPEDNLRRYNLTLDQVAARVMRASLDLPGGTIKTGGGQILLRTKERRYTGREYADIIVVSNPDGARLRLGEIADVRDTFRETDMFAKFDGKPAAMVKILRVGEQKPTEISDLVLQYVKDKELQLPESVRIAIWRDLSEVLESRLNLMQKNAFLGLCMVIIALGLFLELRLAFWVMLGVPISFFGAMLVMPSLGVSINMMSLFAFILALGIVVDDAIVVGENIFSHRQMGKPYLRAAVDGVLEVAVPVTFSILTTVAAFLPLAFIGGVMGKFMKAIPLVVISLLIVSLIESLFVLPAHLSMGRRRKTESGLLGVIDRLRRLFSSRLEAFAAGPYRRALDICLRHRYTTLAVSITVLLLSIGVVRGGILKFTFMPQTDSDWVEVSLEMPPGTPVEETGRIVDFIVEKGMETVRKHDSQRPAGSSIFRHVYALVGGTMSQVGPRGGPGTSSASHIANITLLLTESEERNFPIREIENRWRNLVGELPGVESLTFSSNLIRMGANIDVQLSHNDFEVLEQVSEKIKGVLAEYPGVYDIRDTYARGKRELKLRLRPEAVTLGITEENLARQVRGAFYGAEALRLQIGRNEVKVMVRYPEKDRKSLWGLESMRIRTPAGGEMPLARAAYIEEGRGFSTINRTDRNRVINVSASVDPEAGNSAEIIQDLRQGFLPRLTNDHPGLHFRMVGEEKVRGESMGSMLEGFALALLAIYALLAIPFRSYAQPFLIMAAIPFGIVGAIIGHLIMGYDLSMLSFFGLVALSGVVVNDSLILIHRVNSNRREGSGIVKAVMDAGQRRLRPILLTSLTTFLGLTPMILETSFQARVLIPMAISLGFGILFATGITLLLIPSMYMILEDFRALAGLAGPGPDRGSPAEGEI
ncbi:MAG: efflux RND transporter permease subunit [Gemmatimonadota bacterium]|nr:efflux RND transporter permease subunit [Gemmatimonadota bacterium]